MLDYELFYKEIISKYIKYDKDKDNKDNKDDNNNFNYKKETSIVEKILFRDISLIKNKEENNYNNLNSLISSAELSQQKALKDFPKISKAFEEYYFSNKNEINTKDRRDTNILLKINDELKSKNFFNTKNMSQSQESIKPYPKLYLLSEQKLEKIKTTNKISLTEISKYF